MNKLEKEGCIKDLDQETSDLMIDRISMLASVYIKFVGAEDITKMPIYIQQFATLMGSWLMTGTATELCTLSHDERGAFIGMSAIAEPGEDNPSFNSVLYIYRPTHIKNLVQAFLNGLGMHVPGSGGYMGNKAPVPLFVSPLDEGYGGMIGVLLDEKLYNITDVMGSLAVAKSSFDNIVVPCLPKEMQNYFKKMNEMSRDN